MILDTITVDGLIGKISFVENSISRSGINSYIAEVSSIDVPALKITKCFGNGITAGDWILDMLSRSVVELVMIHT